MACNPTRLAICFHAGHAERIPEFMPYINSVFDTGFPTDLYVTYQKDTDNLEPIKSVYPNAIFIKATRGCDTGAFLLQMKAMYERQKNYKHPFQHCNKYPEIFEGTMMYDYILKIHTKSDPFWRHELLDPISGHTDRVFQVIENFIEKPQIGMIGGDKWIRKDDRYTHNQIATNNLSRKFHLKWSPELSFVAGTIFWVRWDLLCDFIEDSKIDLEKEYERTEEGIITFNTQYVASITHSWERLLGFMVYHYNKIIYGRPMPQQDMSLLPVDPYIKITRNTQQEEIIRIDNVTKISYGYDELVPKEHIDLTESCLHTCPGSILFNLSMKLGNIYPGKNKKIYFYKQHESLPCCAVDEINGFFTRKMLVNKNDRNEYSYTIYQGPWIDYRSQYYDLPFDYEYYKLCLSSNSTTNTSKEISYKYCFNHMIQNDNLPYEIGINLLEKYNIKIVAFYTLYIDDHWNIIKSWAPSTISHRLRYSIDGFYDSNSKSHIQKHIELAKQSGIEGFIVEHYWSEKPKQQKFHNQIEQIVLNSEKFNINFALTWTIQEEIQQQSTSEKDNIIPQEWQDHFNYLLPFFKESRYIKIKNQPLFLINSTKQKYINTSANMINYWKDLSIKHGFSGIFIIQTPVKINQTHLFNQACSGSMGQDIYDNMNRNTPFLFLSRYLVNNDKRDHINYFRQVLAGWDPSAINKNITAQPRVIRLSPKTLGEQLRCQLQNIIRDPNRDRDRDQQGIDNILFINSWNDWAHQSIIEPDDIYGYGMTNAIKAVLDMYRSTPKFEYKPIEPHHKNPINIYSQIENNINPQSKN